MPWFKYVCKDVLSGGSLGIVKCAFDVSLFTESEASEISFLKKLALSTVEKFAPVELDPIVCDHIRNGQKSALETFTGSLSAEAIVAGVCMIAELVCTKSFKERFSGVLMDACLNLVGC